ncbi:Irc3p [Rhizophagus irregularis DAOM 197198w]|uniref:Irc3p n=1 Tax=Rhizophagus irregularis (strain DAOM 197198w) TaxID=1432141 RepID=A0A015KJH0_RHIIW|nr:Irc3p [Rhizophagus irregularis DAOM 197198w]
MSRPTKSPVLFQQMIGRGMRLSPEKEDCLVLDFIDSYSQIPDLVTTPTLLGLDPTMEMKDENLESLYVHKKKEKKSKITIDTPTKIHITEYSNPFEIIDDCSGAKYIGSISENVWLRVGEDSYVISLQSYGTIKVKKENGTYCAIKRKKISRMVKGTMKHYYVIENLPITSDSLFSTIRATVYIPVAVRILEKSRAWNDNIDKGIRNWISDFSNWLMNSNLGKQAFKRSNNHATFYVAQLATYLEFSGRIDEARNLIRKFSETTFQNMILKSGEQPMESKRTKPYHYQCFNLEALTYIALLSQKINGTNLWEIRTKDGATIQNAVDYLIPLKNQDAGQEGEAILLPALYKARDYYGDRSGKYANTISKFLKTTNGASEWWTIYSPKSLRDGNVKNSNGKSYNYDNYDSYSENSATSLFGTSLYAMLSFGLGVFFVFLY